MGGRIYYGRGSPPSSSMISRYRLSRVIHRIIPDNKRAACIPESLELTERMGRWLDRGLKSPFEISREFDNQSSR